MAVLRAIVALLALAVDRGFTGDKGLSKVEEELRAELERRGVLGR